MAAAATLVRNPPWTDKAISLVGTHEAPGAADNPVILGWAQACGGKIAQTYPHDSIAWCALFVNYCLISTGQQGDDSLLALDFQHWGKRLPGPAVGAVVTRKRQGGGHVMIVGGRDPQGRLVGVGGNVSDEVKQQTFALDEVVSISWPAGYPAPASTDFDDLPLVNTLVLSGPVNAPTTTAAVPKGAETAASAALASGISQRAFDFIIAREVTDRAAYEHGYHFPTWPGASSGVTVGIGYDLGQTSEDNIRADWHDLPDAMVEAMASCAGVTGQAAQGLAAQMRGAIDVPWAAALAVFRDIAMPRWVGIVRRALPNTGRLSPDCLGALVSLTYNRGPNIYTGSSDRFREARAIKQDMADGNLADIPGQIRAMKRLWPSLRGLRDRRDGEAELFEQGLAHAPAPPISGEVVARGSAAGAIATVAGAMMWLHENPFVVGLLLVGLYAAGTAVAGLTTTKPGRGKNAMADPTVKVPIESAAKSKVIWVQAVALALQFLSYKTGKSYNLDPDTITMIAMGLATAQGAVTAVIRNWFTKTITPASAGK